MIAVRVHEFGGPEALKLEEMPDLHAGPGQVVVNVYAVGVNPVETYVRAGTYPRLPPLPYTPGADAAGTVAEVGEGVLDLEVGDSVYMTGTLSGAYASQALCSTEQVRDLPTRITFAQGATVGIACGAAWRALFNKGKATAGQYVLVHGASGGVGSAAVQLAHAAGCVVIGTAGTGEGLRLVRECGADHAIGHDEANDVNKMKELTNGSGVNLTIEMLADRNLGADLGVMARNGRVIIVGSRGRTEIDPRMTMGIELSIFGMSLYNATHEELNEMHESIWDGMESGALKPVIGREISLADVAEAHRAVRDSHTNGNIVLTVSQPTVSQ